MIYDFLVIGGGIAGASAAYELAADASVLLLEAEDTTGYHATGRSAALFTRNYGCPIVMQINATSAHFFQSPPLGFCETPLVTTRGCLTVASGGLEGELDALLARSEPSDSVCRIAPQNALEMAPFLRSERVADAVFEAGVSDIDVAALHLGFINGAKARGAIIATKHRVLSVLREDRVWRVNTASESFSTACIVNAAGAWADKVGAMVGARSIGLVPKRRTAIIVKAPAGLDCAALPSIDFAGTAAYLKPDAGRIMASPGDATPSEPYDAWPDDMDIAVLVDWIERETKIKVARIEHSWAGLRSFVADEAPVVGFDPDVPDFFWLAGQGGYGIMMAPVLAKLTAELCTATVGAHSKAFAQSLAPERTTQLYGGDQ
ncbi:FAD-dependent oxidoreductase [Pseudosulfitobacter sp. SM2401]|uniref:NAD(P)/FAD-dependent oxidoreductase n=1 Tax=Pseudosulfitobacter sp. SM2401 TaxID=3350098 RepID=UPI0036F2D89C